MLPLLHDGDIIWAMKNQWHEYFIAPLKQNDIVILNKSNKTYIKRVIGLPNDSIILEQNSFVINNETYMPPQAIVSKRINPKASRALEFRAYLKENNIHFSNADNGLYLISSTKETFNQIDSLGFVSANLELSNVNKSPSPIGIKLKKNSDTIEYYVLSQDLYFGSDSREFGPVNETEISHKAMFLIFSRNKTSFSPSSQYTFFKTL